MALGKRQKQAKNLYRIIKPKLDRKMLSDEFFEELKEKDVLKTETFKLFVYSHDVLNGVKKNKEDWINWLEKLRAL